MIIIKLKQLQPQLWIIAGVNGSGKTGFTNKYLRGKIAIINPDEISIQAGKKAILARQKLMQTKTIFAIETTMSGKFEISMFYS